MDFISKNYYLFGCLVVLVPVGILEASLLFSRTSNFYLRGISPWTFFISFLVTAVIILTSARYLDNRYSNALSLPNSMLKVFILFVLGSLLLYFITHAGVSYDRKTSFTIYSMRHLKILFLFLIIGSPVVISINYIYFKFVKFLV